MGMAPPDVRAPCSLLSVGNNAFILTNLLTRAKFSLTLEGERMAMSSIRMINGKDVISDDQHILVRGNGL